MHICLFGCIIETIPFELILCVYLCMNICMDTIAALYTCLHVDMYVCTYVRIYVYMYTCTYVYICCYIYSYRYVYTYICIRPRMEKSHSCWPRTIWCVVNMFHKNGMRPLIIANGTKLYSILHCNSPELYIRLKHPYSVISVKLDWLPGNSKKWTID